MWFDGAAVAVIESGVVYYIRSDHIGRPVFATNAAGVQVWGASYLPFGGVRTSTGTPITLRFPGQWFQSESGLHQNWMRDYDPTSGRYLQADPLGLVDGASVYEYVKGNPGRWIDPRGEQTTTLSGSLREGIFRAVGKVCAAAIGDVAAAAAPVVITAAAILAASATAAGDGSTCDSCTAPPPPPNCDEEWQNAEERCAEELAKRSPNRSFTGGYKTIFECARGYVSVQCGGNPIDYGKQTKWIFRNLDD